MAVELEQKVMQEIGLGQHYSWFNGSGSCDYCRNNAISKLPQAAQDNGLTVSPKWLEHCQQAARVDNFGSSNYGLTNTWIACSCAIQDAIYRKEGGESAGYAPPEKPHWHFTREEKRQQWNEQQNYRFGRMPHFA